MSEEVDYSESGVPYDSKESFNRKIGYLYKSSGILLTIFIAKTFLDIYGFDSLSGILSFVTPITTVHFVLKITNEGREFQMTWKKLASLCFNTEREIRLIDLQHKRIKLRSARKYRKAQEAIRLELEAEDKREAELEITRSQMNSIPTNLLNELTPRKGLLKLTDTA